MPGRVNPDRLVQAAEKVLAAYPMLGARWGPHCNTVCLSPLPCGHGLMDLVQGNCRGPGSPELQLGAARLSPQLRCMAGVHC